MLFVISKQEGHSPPDPKEPQHIAEAIATLSLRHAVITSVDRDDLPDGGASHFVACLKQIRLRSPNTTIEILTPDFRGKKGAVEIVLSSSPDVFNHNIETVPSLYRTIRPRARYFHSLHLLKQAKDHSQELFTKSGIMVGLGEKKEEIIQVMDDLRVAEVDFLTIGQYLQPTSRHAKVQRYVTPEEFDEYKRCAKNKGFLLVSSSPLTRSSYHADEDFQKLRSARLRQRVCDKEN